jgi:uncharacterized membrane protein
MAHTLRIVRPFYPLLWAFAASCFLGTLVTDIAYWRTADIAWVDFSDWLVTAGVIIGYWRLWSLLLKSSSSEGDVSIKQPGRLR